MRGKIVRDAQMPPYIRKRLRILSKALGFPDLVLRRVQGDLKIEKSSVPSLLSAIDILYFGGTPWESTGIFRSFEEMAETMEKSETIRLLGSLSHPTYSLKSVSVSNPLFGLVPEEVEMLYAMTGGDE